MPWASLAVMAATGSPGIRRGRMKFRMNADDQRDQQTRASFFEKVFPVPFQCIPPSLGASSHALRKSHAGSMAGHRCC